MRLFASRQRFPAQIWLLFWCALVGSAGIALVWPFLTIYIREQLDVPLSQITLLFTLQSVVSFAATALVSPVMDRMGRKWPMVVAMVAGSVTMIAMSQASALWQWALLLPLYTIENAVFRIGSFTMVADLIEPERRSEVYALTRMGDNLGIAVGPALGGFLIAVSYALSFYAAAAVQGVLAVLIAVNIHETLPEVSESERLRAQQNAAGYGPLLHDRAFLTVWGLYILVQIANAMVFMLLGLHVKENFGIPEDRYGFIIGANAVMVVVFQYSVTRRADRYAPLPVIASGALLYALGMAGFALSRVFAAFLLSMIILTLGELLLMPTANALVANIAPAHMRARYIGIFSQSFRIGAGIGPVMGGLLSDRLAPTATWYGGMVVCLIAAGGFWLARREVTPERIARGDVALEQAAP